MIMENVIYTVILVQIAIFLFVLFTHGIKLHRSSSKYSLRKDSSTY